MNDSAKRPASAPRTAAFYLPQFHPIPENDEWWGQGFTEWVNVRKARPMFAGHPQPRRPVSPFGEYDLRDPNVIVWQTRLAKSNDIDAFIYYHYWFDGRRLLEMPLDRFLASSIDHQFAICWANENWTRRWDGKQREILLGQHYTRQTPSEVFQSFLPYLRDERYLTVDGRKVIMVHRTDHLPNARQFAESWRQSAQLMGIGELWLVASETSSVIDHVAIGFDAIAEFPPVGDSTASIALRRLPKGIDPRFRGRVNSYEALANKYMTRPIAEDSVRHPCVIPGWDNTARRGSKATVFVGASPHKYSEWLNHARCREERQRGDQGIVFVNAWNEWAEGAVLEPDAHFGQQFLLASRWGSPPVSDQVYPVAKQRLNVRGLAMGVAASLKLRGGKAIGAARRLMGGSEKRG